ncbi:LysR substrate-binding domain-containing protein [Vibrio campbellii]|uniref:LysR substrate-binding domain-containing protein n=1 Tax=Vibrio campbellii (strain ATCC BAA-1116) TaxID=2902295 RepID=A7N3Q6_VIBC1|nr:LysR substrate-binding domain-containing protein [Vibrio campbellii]ABU72685.1 hypothetical protein VIBHAR_04776 [Vibrio campbellii ATCC BAA-1116]AGU98922.1 hypothetical protein M892_27145 [Vibrio campbellii ATCC BAA-1116]
MKSLPPQLPIFIQVAKNGSFAKAALAGSGIAMLGSWLFKEELRQQSIVPILQPYWGEPVTIWVYYSSMQYLPNRVRLLVDYLIENIHRVA